MKNLTGSDVHRASGREAQFVAEYRTGLTGVSYSGTITLVGCSPSRVGGFMTWRRKTIPPGRAVERAMRESIQFLHVERLLLNGG
jgi:hydrogenase maturation factor HypE